MKYTCTIEINAPIIKVVLLWENEDYFKEWQNGFVKIEHLSGEKGKKGAKSKIFLEQGKRKMELLETVLVNDLPTVKTAFYEHKHMSNTQTSRFEEIDQDTTRYISEVEYVKFNAFLPKMMAKLFPSMFKKQSQKWMNQFKAFVEK